MFRIKSGAAKVELNRAGRSTQTLGVSRCVTLKMLPEFRYHPDPLSTGGVKVSDNLCRCCGQTRGYIYAASFYAADDLDDSQVTFYL